MALRHEGLGGSIDKVDPLASMILWLYENIDVDTLNNVLYFFKDDVDDGDEDMETDDNANDTDKFFEKLRARKSDEEIVVLLQKVFDLLGTHYDTGEKFADIIRERRDELAEMLKGFEPEIQGGFIGREDETAKIIAKLEDERNQWKGVCICGMGGNGKTTLARKVCSDLYKATPPWDFIRIDLREKSSMLDILRYILTKNDEVCRGYEERVLENQVLEICKATTKKRTIWLLDDVDSAMTQSDPNSFLFFLGRLLGSITDDCKIKLLITSRCKLTREGHRNIRNGLYELELGPLEVLSAEQLLRNCLGEMQIEDVLCNGIVKGCFCSPLAIGTIAAMMRDNGLDPRDVAFNLNMDKKNVTGALRVKDCIKQTFSQMDQDSQLSLIKLSVFQTSPFTRSMAQKILSSVRDADLVAEASETVDKLCNRHLLQIDNVHTLRESGNYTTYNYSLHPVVFQYLTEKFNTKGKTELEMQAWNEAVAQFVIYMEGIVNRIWKLFDSKCMKALKELEEQRQNIMAFYQYMLKNPELLPKYESRTTKSKHILVKKRVSDMTDLLLPDLKKRQTFCSEAKRAESAGNKEFYIFWKIEEADVFLLQDRAEIALDILGKLHDQFPYLRNFSQQTEYTPLVHALFHKVKGQCHRKQLQTELAMQHLQLAEYHYNNCRPQQPFQSFIARVKKSIGQIYFDKQQFEKALEYFEQAYDMAMSVIAVKSPNETKRKHHLDIPLYLNLMGTVHYQIGKRCQDQGERVECLQKANLLYDEALELDVQLKLDYLEGTAEKQKNKADVLILMDQLDDARKFAELGLDLRRETLQLPHFRVAESAHQVGKIYYLLGNKEKENRNKDAAMKCWKCSEERFQEMMEHHLINGSLPRHHPLYGEVKADHFKVLEALDEQDKTRKAKLFYEKLEAGKFKFKFDQGRKALLKMTHTTMELISQLFGGGGSKFGEAATSFDDMEKVADSLLEGTSLARTDSGVEEDSSVGESLGSSASEGASASGISLSEGVRMTHLQHTESVEDEVFADDTSSTTKRKRTEHE